MRQHRQEDPDRTATPPVERGSRHRLLNVMEAHRDRFEQIVLPVAVTITGIASLLILDQPPFRWHGAESGVARMIGRRG